MHDPANTENEELEALVGQAADEYTDRINRGESVEIQEYVARFPQIADVLRQMLPSLGLLGNLGSATREPQSNPLSAALVPEFLGDYHILRQIGRGGMGVVYEAEQKSLARRVALKILPNQCLMDPLYLKRFDREAQAAARLHHTNIVPVFGAGEHNGIHFYAMQFIAGQGLDRVIEELRRSAGNGFSDHSFIEHCRRVALIGVQVAEALAYAHSQGILHRDIKPSNLLLDSADTVWVTDFGLAKVDSTEDLTHTGDIVGTMRYAAPERLAGKSDARSDIFSLGLTLYELLTLRPAYDGKTQGRLVQQVTTAEPTPPRRLDRRIPSDLNTIIQKALAKEPERRYAAASELARDLQCFLEDRPITARRTSQLEKTWRWCRRNPVVATLIAIVALMTLTIAIGSTVTAGRLHTGLVRAEKAEDNANRRLYDSLLAQARASRWSGKAGQRIDSLHALGEAAQLARTLDLGPEAVMVMRNEAIACLALTDASPAQTWELSPPDPSSVISFDERLEHCARRDCQGNIMVWRTGENTALARLPNSYLDSTGFLMSPCGRYVANQGVRPASDKLTSNLAVWDWAHEREAVRLPHHVAAGAFAFSASQAALAGPDPESQSDQLVVGLDDGTIVVHELPGCQEIKRLNPLSPTEMKARPSALAIDAKAIHLAVSSSNDVFVRRVSTGEVVRKLQHPGYVNCLAWHPDGDLLAVACHDGHIYLWNCSSGRSQAILTSVLSSAIRMSFSSTGDVLMTWSWDGAVRLWNPWTGQQLVNCSGVGAYLEADGHHLVARQGSKHYLWKVAPGLEYQTLPNPVAPGGEPLYYRASCISSDRRWLFVGCGDGIRIWDLQQKRLGAFLPVGNISHSFHSSAGEFFSFGPGGLYRWPCHANNTTLRVGPPHRQDEGGRRHFAMNLDCQARMLALRTNGGIDLSDMSHPDVKPRFLRDRGTGVAVSPDGMWVVSTPWNGQGIKVWDTRTDTCIKDLLPNIRVAEARFSPQGDWLATQTAVDYQLWKVGDWQLGRSIPRETDSDNPGPIAWSPDGTVLAVTISSRHIRLVEAASGLTLATLEPPNTDPVGWLDFSADGSQLIALTSSPGRVRIWDLRAIRQQLATLGLDWDLPLYPPAAPQHSTPMRVEVQLGELASTSSTKASR